METSICIVLITVAALFYEAESRQCPPRSQVPGYRETCTSDYDCKHGMMCCPNWSNTRSCTYPAPYGRNKRGGVDELSVKYLYVRMMTKGSTKNCGDVKCKRHEVCRPVDTDTWRCLPNKKYFMQF